MTNPSILMCLLTIVACFSSLEHKLDQPSTTPEELSVYRMKRALPKHVFQCDGNASSSCEADVCKVLCDEIILVILILSCFSYSNIFTVGNSELLQEWHSDQISPWEEGSLLSASTKKKLDGWKCRQWKVEKYLFT